MQYVIIIFMRVGCVSVIKFFKIMLCSRGVIYIAYI